MKEIKSVVIQIEKCEITKKNDHSLEMIKNSSEMEFDKAYIYFELLSNTLKHDEDEFLNKVSLSQ